MSLNLIVAYDDERGIGKANGLLWHIPAELKHFKELTTGHPIVMGRKTYESIGRPLPDRTNIVITRQAGFKAEGCLVVPSLEDALTAARSSAGSDETFIIGGAQIYEQALPQTKRLYVTEVAGKHQADTFFPDIDDQFEEISREPQENDGYRYAFLTLERHS